MVRQVYFDPYGMRTQGFRAGMQDMINLQDQTRRARASDWDYNNMAPLRLSGAQRQERLSAYGEPYAQRAYGINEQAQIGNLYDADQARAMRYGELEGDYSIPMANNSLYFGGRYLDAPQARIPYSQYIQQQNNPEAYQGDVGPAPVRALAEAAGIDPEWFMQLLGRLPGRFSPQTERSYDQYQTWDRSRQYGLDTSGIAQQRAAMGSANTNALVNYMNAQSLAHDRYNNRGNLGVAGGYTGEEDGVDGDF